MKWVKLFSFLKSHRLLDLWFCILKVNLAFIFSSLRMQPMRLERWAASTGESLDTVSVKIANHSFQQESYGRELRGCGCIRSCLCVRVYLKGPWRRKLWDQSSLKTSLSLSGSLLRCWSQTVRVVTQFLKCENNTVSTGKVFLAWQDVSDRNMGLQCLNCSFPPLYPRSGSSSMASACGGSLALMDAGTGEGMNDVFTVDNVCSRIVHIYYFYWTWTLQQQF